LYRSTANVYVYKPKLCTQLILHSTNMSNLKMTHAAYIDDTRSVVNNGDRFCKKGPS